jgi:GH24 family phage-related lysozyme (muramidase)
MTIKLSSAITNSGIIDEWDLRQLKKALNRLGYYQPDKENGITDNHDQKLFDALKAYQRTRKLPVTGRVAPDDPTIKNLNVDMEKGQEGHYIWRSVDDEKVRPAHSQYSGTVRAWKDSPDPGEDYNCRCWADTGSTLIDEISDAEVLVDIEDHEKYIEHLYRDHKGNVTIGIGINMENPNMAEKVKEHLILRDPKAKGGERRATEKEIDDAYGKVKNSDAKLSSGAKVYKPEPFNEFTDIYFPKGKAFDMAHEHLRKDIKSLEQKFPEFKNYPPAAQRALLDMEYNIGQTKFNAQKWPGLFSAVKSRDWQTAANESHRAGIGEGRNEWTKDLFQQASQQKARIFKV